MGLNGPLSQEQMGRELRIALPGREELQDLCFSLSKAPKFGFANVAEGTDGTWSTPDARPNNLHTRTAGFLYEAALSLDVLA
jgi:hypothetical protein